MVEEIQGLHTGPLSGLLIDHPTDITGLSDPLIHLLTGLILLTGREVGLTLGLGTVIDPLRE